MGPAGPGARHGRSRPRSIVGTSIKACNRRRLCQQRRWAWPCLQKYMGSVSHLGIVVLPPRACRAAAGGYVASERRRSSDTRSGAASPCDCDARICPNRLTGFTGSSGRAASLQQIAGSSMRRGRRTRFRLRANLSGAEFNGPTPAAMRCSSRPGWRRATVYPLDCAGRSVWPGKAPTGGLTALPAGTTRLDVRLFDGEPEIMSVFFKPVPVCNFAQTPCLRRGGCGQERPV